MSNHDASSSSIRNEMTCPICAGIFIDPRILECGHVFCLRCIFTLVTQTSSFRTSTRLLRCPLRCENMTYLLDDVDALYRSDDGDRKQNINSHKNNSASSLSSLCNKSANKSESMSSFLVHPERVDDSLIDAISKSMKQNTRINSSSLLSPGQLQQIRSLYQDLKQKQKLQKHHQDIARSVMKLPKSLIIGNVSLIMRQQELKEEESTNYSSCSCEICFDEVATEDGSDEDKSRNSSSSIVCCECCGMFLCPSCKNNEANEHGLFCGKTAPQNGGDDEDLTLAGIQPCLYSKVLAMTSALKNRHLRHENKKEEEQKELPDKNNHALLQDFNALESCHVDYLPFRCVTVKCEAKSNNNSDDDRTHQNQNLASLSSFKMLYRVWIRNGMKPRIEPYVPLLQELRPSPERRALFDLQIFVDVVADLVRSFDKVPSMMSNFDVEGGEQKISLESKEAFETNISLLFELRTIANICFLLQSTVLPLIRSKLVSTAVVGCHWAMKIREAFFQNSNNNDTTSTSSTSTLSSSEQLAFSYMNRHLAHEEEDANETGRMILAHLESLQKEVYEARKKLIKQYTSIIDSGWNTDSELGSVVKRLKDLGVVGAADPTNNTEQPSTAAADHHTPSATNQQKKPFEVLFEKFSWFTSAMAQLGHQTKSFQENDDHADLILASNQNQLIENAFPSLLLHEIDLLQDYTCETGKMWAVLDWMPFCNLLTDDEEREPSSSSINFGSSSSLTAFKKVVDLRRRHVRSVLEFSVKPASHYYNNEDHQKLFSLLLSSKKKAEKLREKDEQQLQLLGKGGFEKAIVSVLSNAAKCERELHSSMIERAQIQIKQHHIVLDREDYDENLQFLDGNDEYHNKQSATRKPLFMSKFHPFRSTVKEHKQQQQSCDRKHFLQSDIIDSKIAELIKSLKEISDHHNGIKAVAKQSSIHQQRKQQAEQQQVHLLSSIDPRLVVPKSSTRISDASKLKKLPTAHRCEAEKLALQRFSIDVESVFWNATTTRQNTIRRISEAKKRKKMERNKIKERENSNNDDDDAFNEQPEEELCSDENLLSGFSSSDDDDDGEVEVESEFPTAMKKNKWSDFSSRLLEFGNDSEASSEFEGDSDYYDDDDDDYNDGLVGDDFSDTGDDDTSGDDDDESELRFYTDNDDDDDNDQENENNNGDGEQENRNNQEANQFINSGGDKKSDRATEARRIRMNQFPQLRFKASTISHRILHQPHVLARCRFTSSNKNKNKKENDNQNSDDVVEEKEDEQHQSERVLLVVDATTASRYQVVEYEISASTNNNNSGDDEEENQFSNDLLARFARRANGGIAAARRRNNNQMRFEGLEWDADLDDVEQPDEGAGHAQREEEDVDNIYSDDDNYIRMNNNIRVNNNNNNSNNNMNLFTEHADHSEGVLIAGQQYGDDDNNNNNSRSRRAGAGNGIRRSNPPMQEPRTVLHQIMRTSACFWIANATLLLVAFGMSRKKTSNMN